MPDWIPFAPPVPSHRGAVRRRTARPTVELLEDRAVPSVFGTDNRQPVTNTTAFPFSAVGRLAVLFSDGASFSGTGALIDASHALTAGHVIYDADHGGWATSVTFTPGQDGTSQPFGTANATTLRSYTGWTQNRDTLYDIGLVTLDRAIGNQAGWLGVEAQSDAFFNGGTVNSAGYPGDKPTGTMYRVSGPTEYATQLKVYYRGTFDTAPGQSGSPVWRYDSATGQRYLVAVHTNGGGTHNSGTRITSSRLDDLTRWMREDQTNAPKTGEVQRTSPTAPPPGPFQGPEPEPSPGIGGDPGPAVQLPTFQIPVFDPLVTLPPTTTPTVTLPPTTPPVTLPSFDLPFYFDPSLYTDGSVDFETPDPAPAPRHRARARAHRRRRRHRRPARARKDVQATAPQQALAAAPATLKAQVAGPEAEFNPTE